MITRTCTSIVDSFKEGFVSTYRTAGSFVKTEMYQKCLQVLANPNNVSNIVFANRLEIAPIKALLIIMEDEGLISNDYIADEVEGKNLGRLCGYLFKFVLGYTGEELRGITVGMHGVITSRRYTGGPMYNFK